MTEHTLDHPFYGIPFASGIPDGCPALRATNIHPSDNLGKLFGFASETPYDALLRIGKVANGTNGTQGAATLINAGENCQECPAYRGCAIGQLDADTMTYLNGSLHNPPRNPER